MKTVELYFGIYVYANFEKNGKSQPFHVDLRAYDSDEEAQKRSDIVALELSERFDYIHRALSHVQVALNGTIEKSDEEVKEDLLNNMIFVIQLQNKRTREFSFDSIRELKHLKEETEDEKIAQYVRNNMNVFDVKGTFLRDEFADTQICQMADPKDSVLCAYEEGIFRPDYFTFALTVKDTPFIFNEDNSDDMQRYKEARRIQLINHYDFDMKPAYAEVEKDDFKIRAFQETDGKYRIERQFDGKRYYDFVDEAGYKTLFANA